MKKTTLKKCHAFLRHEEMQLMALGEGTPKEYFNDTPKHKGVLSYLQLPIVLFNMDPICN